MSKKAIVFSNTVYQLFLVINMRLQNVLEGEADLVITDHTASLLQYKETLEQCGLFGKVYYIQSLQRVRNFWRTPADKKPAEFSSMVNDIRTGDLQLAGYDTMFTANFNPYINAVYCAYRQLEVHFYEDGVSACAVDWRKSLQQHFSVPGFRDIMDNVQAMYVNSPELMCVDIEGPIVQLPKIPRRDESVRKLYNQIFRCSGDFKFPRFVFVEQSFQVDRVINNDLELMKIASETVGYENFLVKTHPRNTVNRPVQMGYSRAADCTLPFELMLMNTDLSDIVLITVSSNSLISPWVLFGEKPKTILLYKVVSGGINIPAIDKYDECLDKFVQEYACRELMVPRDIYEYKKLLQTLAANADDRRM